MLLRFALVLFTLTCTAAPQALAQSDGGRRRQSASARGTDRSATADVAGTARLRGRLFAADTSQPVRFADLRVTAAAQGVSLRATTDGAGLFDVPGLPAGVYTLVATKPGFVALQFGQRRPFEPGTPVELAAGETRDLEFALPRGSVITGRITDETGDPVPHVLVSASRYVYGAGGRRRLEPAEIDDTTDDRGQFRIFGLMPGEYVVSASDASSRSRSRAERGASEGYARTYFPGVSSPADAAGVSVGLGQETSANFGLVAARLSTVSGVVTDSLGRPAAAATVVLAAGEDDDETDAVSVQTRQDGSFSLSAVPPGSHHLSVRRDVAGSAGLTEMASVPVSVVPGADVTGLAIATGRGATIEGTIVVRAGSAGERRGLSVAVKPLDVSGVSLAGGSKAAAVDANGRFRLEGVFGAFTLELAGPGASAWTIESLAVDGRDATDRAATAVPGRSVTARVTVSDRVTDVAGAVTDPRGVPRTEFVAVFLPASLSEGVLPTRYVRTARADGDGRFRVQGLPVGHYIVVALESLDDGREWDPAFQAWAREHGTVVRLEGGQQTAVHLQF